MRLRLAFNLVECECGAPRCAAAPCPACGSDATSPDPYVEARRRLLALAEAEVEPGEVESPPLEINEAFALLHAWMDAYTGALEELGSRSEERTGGGEARAAVARLGQALTELEGFKLRLTATQRLRPRLRHWRIIDDLVAGLDQVRDAYLDAFVAESLEEAEASGGRAQEHLDGVTRILDYFNDFTDVTEAMEAADLDDEFAPLVAGAGVVSALAGTGDLGALDRKGQELLRRITGEDLPAATGMGVALLHLEAAAEMLYDSERLWRAAREVYETLSANPQGLQGLLSEAQPRRADVAGVHAHHRRRGRPPRGDLPLEPEEDVVARPLPRPDAEPEVVVEAELLDPATAQELESPPPACGRAPSPTARGDGHRATLARRRVLLS